MDNCTHEGCTCAAGEDGQFCGDYCKTHTESHVGDTHRCECGHAECGIAAG